MTNDYEKQAAAHQKAMELERQIRERLDPDQLDWASDADDVINQQLMRSFRPTPSGVDELDEVLRHDHAEARLFELENLGGVPRNWDREDDYQRAMEFLRASGHNFGEPRPEDDDE
jgi:hypothetical protein